MCQKTELPIALENFGIVMFQKEGLAVAAVMILFHCMGWTNIVFDS
jgi:hypothetical protein